MMSANVILVNLYGFGPRDQLLTKVNDLMDEATQTGRLPPQLAAKLFGCLGFLDTGPGCFGKLGRAGLNTLKERQCSQATTLTDELLRSFEMIRSLLAHKPERELPLQPIHQQRYLAASDAVQDEPRQGSAGLLFVGPQGERDAYVIDVSPHLFDLWSERPTKIGQLELLTVYVVFIFVASQARSGALVRGQHRRLDGPRQGSQRQPRVLFSTLFAAAAILNGFSLLTVGLMV